MSMAYMLPQPPEISCTRSSVGARASWRSAAIADSASDMEGSSGACENRGRVVESLRWAIGVVKVNGRGA